MTLRKCPTGILGIHVSYAYPHSPPHLIKRGHIGISMVWSVANLQIYGVCYIIDAELFHFLTLHDIQNVTAAVQYSPRMYFIYLCRIGLWIFCPAMHKYTFCWAINDFACSRFILCIKHTHWCLSNDLYLYYCRRVVWQVIVCYFLSWFYDNKLTANAYIKYLTFHKGSNS